LRSGADKVSLNSAVIKNPKLIEEAARVFGSSNIVVAIEAIKQKNGEYLAYTDNGREHTGIEVIGWARKIETLGAGEIIITSVDREGTGAGFDVELTKSISQAVSIPVIAHGGASGAGDIASVLKVGGADGVAIASILHYGFISNSAEIDHFAFQEEGNIEFIKKAKKFKNFGVESIGSIKDQLEGLGINCRRTLCKQM
jgi:cyclase